MPTLPIIAVTNQKGGVGKTAVTLGLASAASAAHLRTLLIDLDPQGNVTTSVGVSSPDLTAGDVLWANQAGVAVDAITDTQWDGVSLIPATLALAQRDADTQLGAEMRLRKALDTPAVDNSFDLVLIDCQPSIGKLVSNALIAANGVLIVTEPSIDANAGVANTLETVDTVREHYNPDLRVRGVIINKVPPRAREAQFRITEISDALGDYVWTPPLPHRALFSEARGARKPLHAYGRRAADVTAIFDTYLQNIMQA